MAVVIGSILAIQALAFLGYRAVERHRARAPASFVAESLAEPRPAPDIRLEQGDGRSFHLVELRGGPVLLHFWATWCPPCRKELPALLALGRRLQAEKGIRLVAPSLDSNWDVVRAFFGGQVPPEVVRDPEGGHRRYAVKQLPDTYLVDAAGNTVVRILGARDWTAASAYRLVVAASARSLRQDPRPVGGSALEGEVHLHDSQ